ncbi:hypothetical protein GINT2_001604 [Glugoides intestinalis]
MTTKIRVYRTKVPFSVNQWRIGQRYVLAKYTTDEVKIVKLSQSNVEGKYVTESHKVIDLSKRMPSVIKKLMSGNALLVDEFSTNIDVMHILEGIDGKEKEVFMTKEMFKTKGLLKELDVMETGELKSLDHNEDPIRDIKSSNIKDGIDKKIAVDLKGVVGKNDMMYNKKQDTDSTATVTSTCETTYVSKHYDTNTFSLVVQTIVENELNEDAFKEENSKAHDYDLANDQEPYCFVHKLIKVTVNSIFFGWIADQVKNSTRDTVNAFHEKVIETKDEWINLSEKDLVKLEEEMLEKLLKK